MGDGQGEETEAPGPHPAADRSRRDTESPRSLGIASELGQLVEEQPARLPQCWGLSLERDRVPAQRVGRNYDHEVDSAPDFWLIECDTFWEHVPPAIACTILAGPSPMLSPGEQWLVRVDPPVFDGAIVTDRGLVDCNTPDLEEGNDWSILCTGAYSLAPSVPEDKRRFSNDDWVGGHKITVTTRPEMHGVQTAES